MFGKVITKWPISRWIQRRDFTIGISATGLFVCAMIAVAVVDFVKTAQTKDEQFQVAALKSELAQFVLGVREDDGSPLLENPSELSKAIRPLAVISVKKPFFTFLLNQGNARNFNTKNVAWEAPRSCVVEFTSKDEHDQPDFPFNLRACFAVIPGDASGRYIYFSIRYPTTNVVRHVRGKSINETDHVTLRFKGERSVTVSLVFEPSKLAASRYPMQTQRFAGLHEVTAYVSDDFRQPVRYFNAQAYEKLIEDAPGRIRNYVTILGRLDSSLMFSPGETSDVWPMAKMKTMKVAIAVDEFDRSIGRTRTRIKILPSVPGNSLLSLEQIYVSQILSKSTLTIFSQSYDNAQAKKPLWESSSLLPNVDSNQSSVFQRFSGWWANMLLKAFDYKKQSVEVRQQIQFQGASEAVLAADPIILPDIAARAFFWLSFLLICIFSVGVIWWRAILKLQRITQTAYLMTVQPSAEGSLNEYRKRPDEIGRIGRTFNLLITRARSRNARLAERMRQEESRRVEKIRFEQEHLKSRQTVLDAIGHEIKTPLQALLNKAPPESETFSFLERMRRAVDALYLATSVEAGLKNGAIVIKKADIAAYLRKLSSNLNENGPIVEYVGPCNGIFALFDAIALDQVLDHILDNAKRFRKPGTNIEITLNRGESRVIVKVFNQGSNVPQDEIETIFNYGVSTHTNVENQGLGLFAAHIHVLAMRGSIRAINTPAGFAISFNLPTDDA